MKQIWVVLAVLGLVACKSQDKKKTGSGEKMETAATGATLEQRLTEFLELTDKMEVEKVLDYTYPKLFTIAPRSEVLKAMKDGFDNEEVKVEMDSVKIEKVFPEFEEGNGRYAKVIYSMIIIMSFKEASPDDKQADNRKMMLQSMESMYGEGNVTMNSDGVLRIRNTSPMVAVKDELSKDWTFVNLKEGDPMTDKLFSKAVQEKLATYH